MERKAKKSLLLAVLLIALMAPTISIKSAKSESSEPPATEWNKTYGGTGDDFVDCVIQTSDEGYAIAGTTNSYGAGSYDFWLVKTNSTGNTMWSKTYGGTDNDYGMTMVQTSDGGYALAGSTNSDGAGDYDIWLIKLTPEEMPPVETTLDVQVKVGSIHFRGEIAEFYVLVTMQGSPTDASISATLYYNALAIEELSDSVEHVSQGLYRISYTIPIDASAGTYALVVEANTLSHEGASLETFLLSPTLAGWNAVLLDINGTVGTIKTDLGIVQMDLDEIDAKLVAISDTVATIQTKMGTIMVNITNIHLRVTEIKGNTATIQTALGTLDGKITSVDGNIATIETDMGIVKADIGSVKEDQQTFTTPLYLLLIPILVSAAGVILVAFMLRRKS